MAACCLAVPPAHSHGPQTANSTIDNSPNADKLLADAVTQAAHQHKTVLVMFTASWCQPCHELERFFADPAVHPVFDRNFVTLVIDDGEREHDTRHHNTPGGSDLRDTFHGREAAVPYLVLVDSNNGKKLIDSVRPMYGRRNERTNIGFPSTPVAREWFLQMMHAAPSMTDEERRTIEQWLIQHSSSAS